MQQDNEDVDLYLENLSPLEDAADHQTPQYLLQSAVPVFVSIKHITFLTYYLLATLSCFIIY